MDHFILPLLFKGFQQMSSDFAHASLKGADLQGLIASRDVALQLPENVAAAPFRVGDQAGQDLLPLPFKRIRMDTPPA
jgi:hypothetical protein